MDKNVRINGRKPDAADEDICLVDMLADPDENHNLATDPAYNAVFNRVSGLLDEHARDAVEVPEAYTERDRAQDR